MGPERFWLTCVLFNASEMKGMLRKLRKRKCPINVVAAYWLIAGYRPSPTLRHGLHCGEKYWYVMWVFIFFRHEKGDVLFFWHQVPSITSIMTLYGFVRNGQRVLKIMQPSSAYRYKTTLHGNAMFCTDLQNRRILDGGGRRLFGLSRIWRKVRPSNMKVWFGSGIQMADVWCCAPFQLFGRKCSLLPQCNMGMDGPYIVSFVAVLI